MSAATKHMTSHCEKHRYNFLGLPECPVCVREERDRYRNALHEIIKHSESPSVVTNEAEKALEGIE